MNCLVKTFESIWPHLGLGCSENAAHHKVKNGAWLGSSFMVFDAPERRERHQQDGAA